MDERPHNYSAAHFSSRRRQREGGAASSAPPSYLTVITEQAAERALIDGEVTRVQYLDTCGMVTVDGVVAHRTADGGCHLWRIEPQPRWNIWTGAKADCCCVGCRARMDDRAEQRSVPTQRSRY